MQIWRVDDCCHFYATAETNQLRMLRFNVPAVALPLWWYTLLVGRCSRVVDLPFVHTFLENVIVALEDLLAKLKRVIDNLGVPSNPLVVVFLQYEDLVWTSTLTSFLAGGHGEVFLV